jgi:hypothetical protein
VAICRLVERLELGHFQFVKPRKGSGLILSKQVLSCFSLQQPPALRKTGTRATLRATANCRAILALAYLMPGTLVAQEAKVTH